MFTIHLIDWKLKQNALSYIFTSVLKFINSWNLLSIHNDKYRNKQRKKTTTLFSNTILAEII
jgi:hypothetical protein